MESTQILDTIATSTTAIKEGNRLSELQIAKLLSEISKCELGEGGPYAFPGSDEPDFELNQRVADFLELFNVRLPNVDEYLLQQTDTDTTHVRAQIRESLKERLRTFPNEIAKRALRAAEQTIARDADKQITCIAEFVRQALGSKGDAFSDEDIAQFGLENILFWSSITIYDDFWDEDEKADPKLLPIANLFAREYIDFYTHLFPEASDFRGFFQKSMDLLDQANAWETSACRTQASCGLVEIPNELPKFETYEKKFHPAVGQMFGPVAMLLQLGYSLDSKEVSSLVEYFKHYLIAMQINDDLHDWKEDLSNGHISTVVSVLLAEWKLEHKHSTKIYLDQDMPKLEQVFWYKVLVPLCTTILDHCNQSRIALEHISVLENIAPLEKFIERSEKAAQEALSEHARTLEFIEALQ